MENITQLVEEALCYVDRAMTFKVSRRLAELFEGQAVIECYYSFDVDGFVRYGNGAAIIVRRLAHQEYANWDGETRSLTRELLTSWIEVEWSGDRFQVIRAPRKCGEVFWVVGPEPQVEAFLAAVLSFSTSRSPRTHVYSGWWHESESFDRAIQNAKWDDLVLPAWLSEMVETHAIGFFDAKADFERLGVSWKRGLLFTGPPGNGKTHLIRALLNRLCVPRLVVKSFGEDPDDVQEVFDKVREMAPCVLVLEDIDSLISPNLLSSVLNALDGTEPLNGVLVLATTNHPEKLDPAIRNRPSRFDRVVEFGAPGMAERAALLLKLFARSPRVLRPNRRQLERLASLTDGFSYAYLKELAVSSVVMALQDRQQPVFAIARHLVGELRSQMTAQSPGVEEAA